MCEDEKEKNNFELGECVKETLETGKYDYCNYIRNSEKLSTAQWYCEQYLLSDLKPIIYFTQFEVFPSIHKIKIFVKNSLTDRKINLQDLDKIMEVTGLNVYGLSSCEGFLVITLGLKGEQETEACPEAMYGEN